MVIRVNSVTATFVQRSRCSPRLVTVFLLSKN
nr:MAG TPA: hypothetical protein [Bacteriophage sp.]